MRCQVGFTHLFLFLFFTGTLIACTVTPETAVTATPSPATETASAPTATAVPPTATPGAAAATLPPPIALPVREELTFTVAAQLGGTLNAVALDGAIAYAGVGPRLVTVDIGDPAAPRLLWQSDPLPGLVEAVAVRDGVAYLGAGDRLYLYDAADPTRPQAIGSVALQPGGGWSGITFAGQTVYALMAGSLTAVDVSAPGQPVIAAAGDIPGAKMVSGNVVYVAHEGRLRLLDAATLDPIPGEIALGAGDPYLITAVNDAAIVIGNQLLGPDSILVLDIGNPAQPVERYAGEVAIEYRLSDMRATGETLFLVGQGWPHPGCPSRLTILDIAAAAPEIMSEFEAQGCINGIAVAGDTLVAASNDRIEVYDAGDPLQLALAGELIVPAGINYVGHIALDGDVAYFLSGYPSRPEPELLRMLDLSRPDAPAVIDGVLDLRPQYEMGVSGLYARGDRLFVRVAAYYLIAVDISRPAGPRLLAFADDGVYYESTAPAAVGPLLYAQTDGELGVVDLRDPAAPVLASTVATDGLQSSAMAVAGGNLAVAGWRAVPYQDTTTFSSWLQLYDLSDPLRPVEAGRLLLAEQVGELAGHISFMATVSDTLLAFTQSSDAAARSHTFLAVDITDPAQPAIAGHYTLPFRVYDLVQAGEMIYLATNDGLWVLNVSDGSRPYLAGRLPLGGESLAAAGDWLYLAAGDAGLYVVRVDE